MSRLTTLVLTVLLVLVGTNGQALTTMHDPPETAPSLVHDAQQRAHTLLDGLRLVQTTRDVVDAHVYLQTSLGGALPTATGAASAAAAWRPDGGYHEVPDATLAFLDRLFALHAEATAASGPEPDVARLVAVRSAVVDLVRQAPGTPLHGADAPLVDVCGSAFIHLGATPMELHCDYPLIVGGFGDDTYHNRAGGNVPEGAALAFDLGGHDRYLGRIAGDGGVNGGAWRGFGALVDLQGDDVYDGHMTRHALGYQSNGGANGGARHGVSLLVDLAGTDHYNGSVWRGGVNGGAGFGADSMLIDLDGEGETFTGQVHGLSGGINGGSNDGIGRFLHCGRGGTTYDGTVQERGGVNAGTEQGAAVFASCGGGGDRYTGRTGGGGINAGGSGDAVAVFVHLQGEAEFSGHSRYGGVNGGSYIGATFMVSGGGDQSYTGSLKELGGINGGGMVGTGTLVDLGGDDTYVARSPGTGGANGGGVAAGMGLLLDRSGEDVYDAWVGGAPPTSHTGLPFSGGAVNGAGGPGGCGMLVDLAGTDRYREHPNDPYRSGQAIDLRSGCGTDL